MVFWFTLFAIIVALRDLVFCCKAHARTVLPDFTGLALNHELASIAVVVGWERAM